MNETSLEIPIPNTALKIKGILRGDYSKPLLLLIPGLGGEMNDLLQFEASRYFEQRFSSLRVSLYGYDDNQRDIKDFDVKLAANDIDIIVSHLKDQGAEWVGLIGHSYGGMAAVYSDKQEFDAAILWDPSHTGSYDEPMAINNLAEDFIYIKEIDSYVSGKGPGGVLSRKVFENYQPGSTEMARKFKIPTLVINASFSTEMQRYGKDYADTITAPTNYVIIPDSSHPFVEDGAMEKVFAATEKWIELKLPG